ncbi:MAG: DNA primase [Flavobacteriales bacterium]|nr:DNA primase [Flavobacteriales bacterium]
MISQNTIDKILEASDITEVIGEYVTLKRRGVNMMGNCPFHNEKTPSFVVSPTKGIFKCFGCGRAGNSVGFIMEHNALSYPEALRWLASKYHIEIEEDEVNRDEILAQKSDREALLAALSFANKYFIGNLHDDPEGVSIGKSYFLERGLREDTLKNFELGYAKRSWNDFADSAISNQLDPEILIKAGLIKKREKKEDDNEEESYYDVYRDRVTFPIHDIAGRVIAFGARQLNKEDKGPKYINSPENDVYHKSKVLYGMFQAKKAIRKKDNCYLTEGYLDVITLHQNGIENVVASSGTSLTTEQVKLIGRFTDNVTVLYDGDPAGIKAAMRGTDIILENNLNIKIVLFPEGEDPDSLCKKIGADAFSKYITDNQQDFILFKTNHLLSESKNDPIKKAQVIRDVVESIAKVPDSIKRSVFIKETAVRLETDERVLISEANRIRLKDNEKAAKQIDREIENLVSNENGFSEIEINSGEFKEYAIIKALILFGKETMDEEITVLQYLLNELVSNKIEFEKEEYSNILKVVEEQNKNMGFVDEFFYKNHEKISSLASGIILDSQKYLLSENWEKIAEIKVLTDKENYRKEITQNVLYLKKEHINNLIKINAEKLKNASDVDEVNSLLEIQTRILMLRKELLKETGTSITDV